MAEKLTHDEIADLFGGEIPVEAIRFVFVTAPRNMSMREVRNELEEMAERYRAKRSSEQHLTDKPETVEGCLCAICRLHRDTT